MLYTKVLLTKNNPILKKPRPKYKNKTQYLKRSPTTKNKLYNCLRVVMKAKIQEYTMRPDKDCNVGGFPQNDNDYYAELLKCVFRIGLNIKVIENKWDGFTKAFSNFDFEIVADYGEVEFDRLVEDASIVRNGRKISAMIENAREFVKIKNEFGGIKNYINELSKEGEDHLVNSIAKRFKQIGPTSAFMFLKYSGEDLPECTARVVKR